MATSKINLDSHKMSYFDTSKTDGSIENTGHSKRLDMDIFEKNGILNLNLDRPFFSKGVITQ